MSSRLTQNAAASLSYERRASVDTFIVATRENSGNSNLLVTSAERSSSGQAKAMLDNYTRDSAAQRNLYGSAGQKVLDYFDANPNQSYQQKINGAASLIDRLAAEGKPVSRHLSSFQQANNSFIFDIGYGSITNKQALIDNLKAAGANVIDEPRNGCVHAEISAENLKKVNKAYLGESNANENKITQPRLTP
jgi:hypothetical protein